MQTICLLVIASELDDNFNDYQFAPNTDLQEIDVNEVVKESMIVFQYMCVFKMPLLNPL